MGRTLLLLISVVLLSADLSRVAWGQGPKSAGAAAAPQSVPAGRQATKVTVIVIDDQISQYTAISVKRRLAQAARDGADAVVFELDTPGGAVGAVIDICMMIKQSPVPNTVAWINAKAYSGGAIIALACKEIVVSDAARMGDALPIAIDPVKGLQALPEAERQKILAPLIAEVVDSARRRKWDEFLVQAFVSLGVELWQVENIQTGRRYCVDRAEYQALFNADPPESPQAHPDLVSARASAQRPAVAPGPVRPAAPATPGSFQPASPALSGISGDVAMQIDQSLVTTRPTFDRSQRGNWKFVRYVCDGNGPIVVSGDSFAHYGFAAGKVRNETELAAFFGATQVVTLHQNWSESFAEFLSNMVVRGVLIAIFLIALFTEMTHPGVVLPGVIAFIALGLVVAPPLIAGMSAWWALAAILTGVFLVVLEILVIPGFGLPGIAGLLLLFGGLVGTFVPGSPADATSDDVLHGIVTVLLSTVTAGVGMFFVFRHLPSVPYINRFILKDDGREEGDGMLSAMEPSPGGLLIPGDEGVAVTPLRPSGRAQIGDTIVDVVASIGYLDQGTPIRVVSADRFRVVVDATGPAPEPPRTSPGIPGDQA